MSDSSEDFANDINELLTSIQPPEKCIPATGYERFELKDIEVDNTERDKQEVLNGLLEKMSVEEAEAFDWNRKYKLDTSAADWLDFKSQMQDGDELWTYSIVWVSHGFCCGGEGYAIIRNGDLIAEYVTAIIN